MNDHSVEPGDRTGDSIETNPPCLLRIPYRRLRVELDLNSAEPVSHFLAATIRGGFGYTLKRMVCAFKGNECRSCILSTNCVYAFLFETAPAADSARMKKYRAIPRPFAFRPKQNGSSVILDLLLIGNAVETVPYFIYTLNSLGEHGLGRNRTPFLVSQVADESGTVVYTAEKENECGKLTPRILDVQPGESAQGSVTLHFTAPLVLRKDDAVLAAFETRTFFATLLRRITNINAFYGEDRDRNVDPKPYFAAVETLSCETDLHPVHQHRISTRQKRKIDYSGLTGKIKLTGDTGTLMPFLRAGEVLGVGKNTVFGYGVFGVVDSIKDKID